MKNKIKIAISDALEKLNFPNVNIIIEKPLSISTQNLSKLRKIVSINKLSFIVAYNLEYLDIIIKFHKLLKNIKFGKMYSLRINVGSHLSIWKNSKNYTQFSTSIKKIIYYQISIFQKK